MKDVGFYAKNEPYVFAVWIISASLMFAYTSSQNVGFLVWFVVYSITLIGLIRAEENRRRKRGWFFKGSHSG